MDKPQSKKSFVLSILGTIVALAIALFFYFGGTLQQFESMVYSSSSMTPASAPAPAAEEVIAQTPSVPQLPALPVASSSASKSSTTLTATAAPAPAKKLPYSIATFTMADWVPDWGVSGLSNGELDFGAASTTTGGAVFLADDDAWTNYYFQANVDWLNGQTVSIIARATDPSNFTYCDFSKNWVSIIERTANVDKTINEAVAPNGAAGGTYNLGIEVFGNSVACTVNNQLAASAVMAAGSPAAGGIGFISWDPAPDTSAVGVKSLHVEALAIDNIPIPFPAVAAPAAAETTAIATTTAPAAPAPTTPPPAPASTPAPTAPVALTLPYTQTDFSNDSNWLATWGGFSIDPSTNALDIVATDTTTGALVILQNSAAWTNYKFDATIDWEKGETFGMIARYIDNKDYVVCEYALPDRGDVQVQLEQYINGQENILSQGSIADYYPAPGTPVDAFIQVNNTQGICSLGGHEISNSVPNAYLINAPFIGGIGFTMWDPTANNTQVVVSSISVAPAVN